MAKFVRDAPFNVRIHLLSLILSLTFLISPTTPPSELPPAETSEYGVNTHPKAILAACDARVLVHDADWIFTSPNCSAIPVYHARPREIRPRADCRFGYEDFCSHPQLYSEEFPWSPCIPRRPLAPSRYNSHPYRQLWEHVVKDTFINVPGAIFGNLGVISDASWFAFAPVIREVSNKVSVLQGSRRLPPYMLTCQGAMTATLDRLRSFPMTFRDFSLQYVQCQRMALDLLGMISFLTCVSTRTTQRRKIYELNSDIIGCFTMNPTIAENMFYGGVPVILIRDTAFVDPKHLRIKAVSDEWLFPPDIIEVEWVDPDCRVVTPYRNIAVCPPGQLRHTMTRPLGRLYEDLRPSLTTSPPEPTASPPPSPPRAYSPLTPGPSPEMSYSPLPLAPSDRDRSLTPALSSVSAALTTTIPTQHSSSSRSRYAADGIVKRTHRGKKKSAYIDFHYETCC